MVLHANNYSQTIDIRSSDCGMGTGAHWTEDAQEAGNKDIKNYRENFSRKTSRENTMTDVFNRLLVMSDTFISSMGRNFQHKNVCVRKRCNYCSLRTVQLKFTEWPNLLDSRQS